MDGKSSYRVSIFEVKPKAFGYLSFLPLFKNGLSLKFESNVTFIIGDNGTGKSTILKLIARAYGFDSQGGSPAHHFTNWDNCFGCEDDEINSKLRIGGLNKKCEGFFFRSDTLDTLFKYYEASGWGFMGGELSKMSHGQGYLHIFTRFNKGLFLLDEPENALSPKNQIALLSIIDEIAKQEGNQFIICTHSPIMLSYPNATIYEIGDEGVKKVDYKETEHYRLTKRMLDYPESIFKYWDKD